MEGIFGSIHSRLHLGVPVGVRVSMREHAQRRVQRFAGRLVGNVEILCRREQTDARGVREERRGGSGERRGGVRETHKSRCIIIIIIIIRRLWRRTQKRREETKRDEKRAAKARRKANTNNNNNNNATTTTTTTTTTGIVFTHLNKEDVMRAMKEKETKDFARVGQIATETIVCPEGQVKNADDVPMSHTLEATLRKHGLPTKLNKGVVECVKEKTICKRGAKLSADQCALLRQFGFKLATFKLRLPGRLGESDGGDRGV